MTFPPTRPLSVRWLHNVLQRGQRRAARRKGNGCVSGFLICKQWHFCKYSLKSGFPTKSFRNARFCAETTLGAWDSNAGSIFQSWIQNCLASLQLHSFVFLTDLLEFINRPVTCSVLFALSEMQVTTITCCRHFNWCALPKANKFNKFTSSNPFIISSSGASATILLSKSAFSAPTTATLFPTASSPPPSTASTRWSTSSHKLWTEILTEKPI